MKMSGCRGFDSEQVRLPQVIQVAPGDFSSSSVRQQVQVVRYESPVVMGDWSGEESFPSSGLQQGDGDESLGQRSRLKL